MGKQPLKKKGSKAFTEWMKNKGYASTKEMSNADKEMQWLVMPKGFSDALMLPGIPQNYVSLVVGHSNTGKSTIINHAIVAAQKQGIIPVIYDTENNFDFTYAMDMGMDATPVEEEVTETVYNPVTEQDETITKTEVTRYEGNFIYFNNAKLAEKYGDRNYKTGKPEKKKRKVAVIEDVATSINEILDSQDNGEIDCGFLFIWDSVGSLSSFKSYDSSANNAMWDANAISVAFSTIVNDRIPRSRKISSKYNNTFIAVNKVWMDSMSNPMPGAPPSLSLKGGNSLTYSARLILLAGGKLKASVKALTAETKGQKYTYATQTKISVLKNQLPNPYTLNYSGDIICTPYGIVPATKEDLEKYRNEHAKDIIERLKEMTDAEIKANDIEFSEEEEEI